MWHGLGKFGPTVSMGPRLRGDDSGKACAGTNGERAAQPRTSLLLVAKRVGQVPVVVGAFVGRDRASSDDACPQICDDRVDLLQAQHAWRRIERVRNRSS